MEAGFAHGRSSQPDTVSRVLRRGESSDGPASARAAGRAGVDLVTGALGKNHAVVRVHARLPRDADGRVDRDAEDWWYGRVRRATRRRREGILLYADYALRRACSERHEGGGSPDLDQCFSRQLQDARSALSSCARVVSSGRGGCERCRIFAASTPQHAGTATSAAGGGAPAVIACNSTQRAAELLLTRGHGAALSYVREALKRDAACLDACLVQIESAIKRLESAAAAKKGSGAWLSGSPADLLGAWRCYDDAYHHRRASHARRAPELEALASASSRIASEIVEPLVRADCVEDQRRSLRLMRKFLERQRGPRRS